MQRWSHKDLSISWSICPMLFTPASLTWQEWSAQLVNASPVTWLQSINGIWSSRPNRICGSRQAGSPRSSGATPATFHHSGSSYQTKSFDLMKATANRLTPAHTDWFCTHNDEWRLPDWSGRVSIGANLYTAGSNVNIDRQRAPIHHQMQIGPEIRQIRGTWQYSIAVRHSSWRKYHKVLILQSCGLSCPII